MASRSNVSKKKEILKTLTLEYIKTGQPVGSATLSNILGFSSATIRNMVAALREEGLFSQPHTSAGSIPTESGFRSYVDMLLEKEETKHGTNPDETFLCGSLISDFECLSRIDNMSDLLAATSRMLSNMTNYPAIAISPKITSCVLKYAKFILLKKKKVMSILASDDGLLFKKILSLEKEVTQAELDRSAAYLNNHFAGHNLYSIRTKLRDEMLREKNRYDKIMGILFALGDEILKVKNDSRLFIDGIVNIIGLDCDDRERLKSFLETFEDKCTINRILDELTSPDETKVLLGSDSVFVGRDGCSIIISGYKRNRNSFGIVGVLGPIRMKYDKVIPIVNYTSSLVSKLICHPEFCA